MAGKALKKEELKTFALESFREVFKRSHQEWHLPGPTFCHGISGLLAITLKMAQDTQVQDLKEDLRVLKDVLLGFYKSKYPFGFRDFDRMRSGGYAEIDKAGLLEGASGILLSLLSLHTTAHLWQFPFLIDDGMTFYSQVL